MIQEKNYTMHDGIQVKVSAFSELKQLQFLATFDNTSGDKSRADSIDFIWTVDFENDEGVTEAYNYIEESYVVDMYQNSILPKIPKAYLPKNIDNQIL